MPSSNGRIAAPNADTSLGLTCASLVAMRLGHGLACVLGLAVASAHATAGAAPCPVDAEARLGFIRERIDAAAKPSRQWALGWGIGLGLLTVAQLGASAIVPREDAPDFWFGALQSGIGAGSRAVFIPHVLIERRRMRRRPPTGDTCEQLAAAERALVRSAKWEQRGRALWQHALSITVNAAVGVALGVAFDRPVAGARLGTVGATGGTIMIITQPMPMTRALERYRVRPLVLRGGGGIAFGGGI